MTYRILTVCTANICRSPVAQIFLADALKSQSVQVHSAGTQALFGNEADQTMQNILHAQGHPNISEHRSQALMPSLITKYDLLLCMEDVHVDWILGRTPLATAKVKLLGHWDQARQVSDPIGRSSEVYEESVQEIKKLSQLWADKLLALGVCA